MSYNKKLWNNNAYIKYVMNEYKRNFKEVTGTEYPKEFIERDEEFALNMKITMKEYGNNKWWLKSPAEAAYYQFVEFFVNNGALLITQEIFYIGTQRLLNRKISKDEFKFKKADLWEEIVEKNTLKHLESRKYTTSKINRNIAFKVKSNVVKIDYIF